MTSRSEDYVEGDVNAASDDYVDGDVNAVGDDYEEGDVNAVGADPYDDTYEVGDVNAVGSGGPAAADVAGNRSDGGTPTTVLDYLARSLANEPEAIVIQSEDRQGGVRLRLHVAPQDMGRVIGRRGRTAQAIRTLIGVAGARDGVQTSVDIVDD